MIQWQQHPILTPPTDEEMAAMDPEALMELHRVYHEAIENSNRDPYRYGFTLDNWRKAWELFKDYRTLLLLGANRSGKTTYGAKSVVKAALDNPGSLIYCFSQNNETSVLVQQPAVYQYLPAELKKKTTSDVHYISFSAQNGFAGASLIFPNGSRIQFKTYQQFQQNQSILEGMELGSREAKWINIGAWCDEYLQGMDMLDRLYLRLATRNAKLLLTFTPKDGITETVNNYIRGADTVESRKAELLNNRKVPFLQLNPRKNTAIVYFHSKDNPWSGYESIVEMCKAKNDDNYTLTAAYGVPTKSYTTKFPRFSADVNVIPAEKVPTKGVTRYHVIDPAGKKNWFMLWIAVDASGTWYIYREWPGIDVGQWGQLGRGGKWTAGDGAKGQGYGLRNYIELIEQMEEGEVIAERLIDPRLGAARYQKAEGDSSIIEDLDELDFITKPAPGFHIEDGIQKIVDLMAYDQKKPIDGLNRPHLYVSDECQNLIQAIAEYTGEDGKDEVWKDPIDVLRYAASAEIDHIPDEAWSVQKVGAGGY